MEAIYSLERLHIGSWEDAPPAPCLPQPPAVLLLTLDRDHVTELYIQLVIPAIGRVLRGYSRFNVCQVNYVSLYIRFVYEVLYMRFNISGSYISFNISGLIYKV